MDEHTRQTLIEMLQNGGSIPAEYEEIIFPTTKKEYELKYAGKEREEVILNNTMSAPFQEIKHFGNVQPDEWANMLIFGDNLQTLKHLLKLKEEGKLKNSDGTDGVKLVYIDPPFATKQDFQGKQGQTAYQDKIIGVEFIDFLRKRLILLKDILADDGTIYVHLDYKKIHYIKVILDEIFNEGTFIDQVTWKRSHAHGDTGQGAKHFGRVSEGLLVYSKGSKWTWNPSYIPYSDKIISRDYKHIDEKTGERYRLMPVDGPGGAAKGNPFYEFLGVKGYWRYSIKTMQKLYDDGEILVSSTGKSLSRKRYLHDAKGTPITDLWDDINRISPTSSERINYPTQKPETLIERIIKISSNKGEIILDCFAGSGTTGAVAEKLNRKWILVDSGKLAIYTMQKRMVELNENIGNKGNPLNHKPFILCNAGLYHNEKLVKGMQDDQYKDFVLELFGCHKRNHKINGLKMHGTLNNHSVLVFDKKDYLTYEFIDELHEVVGSSIKNTLYLIAPAGIVGFAEDYVVKDNARYTVLRIPNSIIEYIKEKNFSRLQQPRSAANINQTIDSIGFDFIYPPNVESNYFVENPEDKLIDTQYVIEIEDFEPIQLGTKIVEFKDPKSESLAMVMIDTDYDGDVFKMDKYVFGDEITKSDFKMTIDDEVGKKIMIIYLDIFGNEKREILSKSDFKRR